MKITAQNYFTEANNFLPLLNAAQKEAHQLVTEMRESGIDNPFNTGDTDIDETGQLLLDQVNAILAKEDTTPKPAKANKTPKPKPVKTEKKAKAKAPIPKKVAPKKASVKKTMPVKRVKKLVQKVANKAAKQVKKSEQTKPAVFVKKYSAELQVIKTFANMHGKTYKPQAIINRHKAIINALKAGKLTNHLEVLKSIRTRLGKAVQEIEKNNPISVTVKIEKGFTQKCIEIVNNAKIKMRTEFLAGVDTQIEPGK